MNAKELRSLLLAAIMLGASTASLSAADPSPEDAALSTKLVTALAKSDYDTFIAEGADSLKKGLSKDLFEKTAVRFAVRFQSGYEAGYLGELKQGGCHVTLWKIRFKDQSDDALLTLVVKEGQLAGVWIK